MVFQCGSCHRVISDSNQLISAKAELGVLVLDAVIGVNVGSEVDMEHAALPLCCSACGHRVGRLYQQAPSPSLTDVVHHDDAPRYALIQESLASYVLGSTGLTVNGRSRDGDGVDAGGGDAGPPQQLQAGDHDSSAIGGLSTRIAALEGSDTGVREQLGQLMRVVLALDQRLQSLEGGSGAADEVERKRPRS
jgi:hypothetical protein